LQEILRIIATSPKHVARWKHELYKLRWLLRNNSHQTIFLKLSLYVPYQAMFQQNRIKKIGHHATTSHPFQSPDSYSTLFSLSLHFTDIKTVNVRVNIFIHARKRLANLTPFMPNHVCYFVGNHITVCKSWKQSFQKENTLICRKS